MSEEMKAAPKLDLNSNWEACVDLSARRFVYCSLTGAFGGLLLFRSPVTRWAAVAFGAGIGLGSAYTECSYKFNEFSAKPVIRTIADVPSPQDAEECRE